MESDNSVYFYMYVITVQGIFLVFQEKEYIK